MPVAAIAAGETETYGGEPVSDPYNPYIVPYEFSDNLRTSIPSQFGFGLSTIEPFLQTNILLDFVSDKNNSSIYKIGLSKSFKSS